jgi:hypothetical protein
LVRGTDRAKNKIFKTEDNVPAGKLKEKNMKKLVRDTDPRIEIRPKCHGSPTLANGSYGVKAAVPERSKQYQ